MPKGVEHDPPQPVSLFGWGVPKSEMPKGVEHPAEGALLDAVLEVPKSEMPKGVEHEYYEGRGQRRHFLLSQASSRQSSSVGLPASLSQIGIVRQAACCPSGERLLCRRSRLSRSSEVSPKTKRRSRRLRRVPGHDSYAHHSGPCFSGCWACVDCSGRTGRSRTTLL